MDTTYKVIDNSYYIFMSDAPPLVDIKPLMTGGNSKYIEFTVDSPDSISPLKDFTKSNIVDKITNRITGGFNLDANLSDTDSSSLASEQINRILNKQSGGYQDNNAANFNTDLFTKLMVQGSENSDSLTESLSNQNFGSNASRLNEMRRMGPLYDKDEEDDSDSEDDDEEYDDDDDEEDDDIDKDDEDDEEESYSASSRTTSSVSSSQEKNIARSLSKLKRMKKALRSSGKKKEMDLLNDLTFRSHLARTRKGTSDLDASDSRSPLRYKGNVNKYDTLSGGSSEDESASYLESSINTNSINLIKGTRTIN